jgi:hypothetical protein
MRRSRCPDTDPENEYCQEIQKKTVPDDESHFPVTPYFSYQVINNVGDRENKQTCSYINAFYSY